MGQLRVQPGAIVVKTDIGQSLLDVSKQYKLGIHYSCDGVPNCGTCRIVVSAGEECLSPIEKKEENLVGTATWLTHYRLSCQARLIRDGVVHIDISQNLEAGKSQQVRKTQNSAEKQRATTQRSKHAIHAPSPHPPKPQPPRL